LTTTSTNKVTASGEIAAYEQLESALSHIGTVC